MKKKKTPKSAYKHESHRDFYKLHIDAKPSARTERSEACSKPHVEAAAHGGTHGPVRKQRSKAWIFIWDKVQFVLVSVIVFAAIYIVLNWQALKLIAVHYWDVWHGFESPLEDLVASKQAPPETLLSSASQSKEHFAALIPQLNIEVFPVDTRIIIPRINQNVPVIGVKNENLIARRWDQLEADIQKSLRNGVVHYPGTALPGDNGNVVITGHSSYYAWDQGRFKDVFALLHDVRMGDKVVVYFNQKKFVYEVDNIKTVAPKDVDVLARTKKEQLTLITCTPIGTNLKRLVVTAKLVEKS